MVFGVVDEIACEMMTHEAEDYLRSDDVVNDVHGIIARITAGDGHVTPSLVSALRGSADPIISTNAPLLLELAQGTMRAERLGKGASGWLFTSTMAEQCTHPTIAAHHAAPFQGCASVLEICTGAGRDTAAFAGVVGSVTTVEHDPLVAAVTQGNLHRSGIVNVHIRVGAWPLADVSTHADGTWADPSRRRQGARTREAAAYDPPLASIPRDGIIGIKVGPGDRVSTDASGNEYIGFGRECRERIIWRSPHCTGTRVTRVDVGCVWEPRGQAEPMVCAQPSIVVEPHNAIIASGCVGQFLAEHRIGVMDARIGYGSSNHDVAASPWYQRYAVRAIEKGISVKRMQQAIRDYGWGPTTIFKKRGWDRNPEELRTQLRFTPDGPAGVVIIMRVGDGHQTIYAHALDAE